MSEAEEWAERHSGADSKTRDVTFSHATVENQTADGEGVKLSQPRAYSLALAPHIIHAQSTLLAALVSSRLHNQLDFQAVGSWFILGNVAEGVDAPTKVSRVPSSREDIFKDSSFDLRAKRSLMKFLRFVQTYDEQSEVGNNDAETPFPNFLQQKFGLPPSSHGALLALALESGPSQQITTGSALPKISRHLRSIGVFGPGFGAVLPKWGGLAEIAQVACRSGAVGGGVYVLKKGIESSSLVEGKTKLVLSEGEKISTSWLVGCPDDVPVQSTHIITDGLTKSIFIVSPALSTLFPPTSEGGVTPAGAVVAIPSGDVESPPVHIIAHSHESGECPSSQSKFHTPPAPTHHMMILRKTYLHCLIYIDYKLSNIPDTIFNHATHPLNLCIGRRLT